MDTFFVTLLASTQGPEKLNDFNPWYRIKKKGEQMTFAYSISESSTTQVGEVLGQ